MQKIKETLTSRKFWAMVGGCILALTNADYQAAIAMVIAYIAAQGAVDTAKAIRK